MASKISEMIRGEAEKRFVPCERARQTTLNKMNTVLDSFKF